MGRVCNSAADSMPCVSWGFGLWFSPFLLDGGIITYFRLGVKHKRLIDEIKVDVGQLFSLGKLKSLIFVVRKV